MACADGYFVNADGGILSVLGDLLFAGAILMLLYPCIRRTWSRLDRNFFHQLFYILEILVAVSLLGFLLMLVVAQQMRITYCSVIRPFIGDTTEDKIYAGVLLKLLVFVLLVFNYYCATGLQTLMNSFWQWFEHQTGANTRPLPGMRVHVHSHAVSSREVLSNNNTNSPAAVTSTVTTTRADVMPSMSFSLANMYLPQCRPVVRHSHTLMTNQQRSTPSPSQFTTSQHVSSATRDLSNFIMSQHRVPTNARGMETFITSQQRVPSNAQNVGTFITGQRVPSGSRDVGTLVHIPGYQSSGPLSTLQLPNRPSQAGPSIRLRQAGPSIRPSQAGPSIRPSQAGPSIRLGQAGPSVRPGQTGPSNRPGQAGPSNRPGQASSSSVMLHQLGTTSTLQTQRTLTPCNSCHSMTSSTRTSSSVHTSESFHIINVRSNPTLNIPPQRRSTVKVQKKRRSPLPCPRQPKVLRSGKLYGWY